MRKKTTVFLLGGGDHPMCEIPVLLAHLRFRRPVEEVQVWAALTIVL